MSQTGLVITDVGDVTVVDFRNAAILDAAAVHAVADELYELVDGRGRRKVLLDFAEVRFLASQMLGALVALHRKAAGIDGRVVLCGLGANLRKVLTITRLDGVFDLADSVEAGRAMVGSAEGAAAGSAPGGSGGQGRWTRMAARQVRIFFAGALIVVPLAITAWVIVALGGWLDRVGYQALGHFGMDVGDEPPFGPGALVVLAVTYVFGLLTHVWVFRGFFGLIERLVARLPGIKTVYESIRDLMKLFGGDSERMGRVVQYRLGETDLTCLGVLTNENPLGLAAGDPARKVAVYLPLSYMIGGPTVMVSPESLVEVDMSVEQCMKLCATAAVGGGAVGQHPAAPAPGAPGGVRPAGSKA